MAVEALKATIVVLTFNGEKYLREILTMALAQRVEGEVEVLVIDSGSSDSTLEIVRSFRDVRLHEIPNHEFGHGKTRNLAAHLARGEYVAYLTHDAVPTSDRWLHELLAPFTIDPEIVGVMGKQVPRDGCFPLMKYDIQRFFADLGPDFGTTIFYNDGFATSPEMKSGLTFYSDVNSAARRDILTGSIPYRDVNYAEDQLFGRDVIEAGYHKAYAPRAAVEHSNDLTLGEYGPRIFDETIGLRSIGTPIPPMSVRGSVRHVLRGTIRDTLAILMDRDFSAGQTVGWLFKNPFYHVTKWRNYWKATHVDLTDADQIRARSLEHRRKAAG
jgi:rhamnosyltransferase